MILTMTTVGYGDIFPVTIGGRVFTIICCIIGVFVVSMIIANLTVLVRLNGDQKEAYDAILELDSKIEAADQKQKKAELLVKLLYAKNRHMPREEIFRRQRNYFRYKYKMKYEKE